MSVKGISRFQVTGSSWIHRYKRQPGSSGLQAGDHAEVGILLPFEISGFNLRAHEAQRAHARVTHIGENYLTRAASGHHLVIDQIGCGSCQLKVFQTLANNLMTSSKRY